MVTELPDENRVDGSYGFLVLLDYLLEAATSRLFFTLDNHYDI
jgi:hypothetical protein